MSLIIFANDFSTALNLSGAKSVSIMKYPLLGKIEDIKLIELVNKKLILLTPNSMSLIFAMLARSYISVLN